MRAPSKERGLISLVILAAGLSTRFGGNKLLHLIQGEPMILRVARTALESRVDEVVVVVGHQADGVREALRNLSCRIVGNLQYATGGQSSSVKVGVSSISPEAEAVLILPGDVAFINAEIIDTVMEYYRRNKSLIVIASYRGTPGHPILFDKSLFGEIMGISEGGFGLKEVVDRHRGDVKKVECGTQHVLLDVDTKEDLSRFPVG